MPRTLKRHARVRIVKIATRRNPSRRRRARKSASSAAWSRPRVRRIGKRYVHGKKSRFFGAGPVMVNPSRRRRHLKRNPSRLMRRHRRHLRRNPNIKSILSQLKSKAWIMQMVTVAGGLAAGFGMKTVVATIFDKVGQGQYKKFGGALQIVIGAVLYATMRKPALRTMGGMIAGIGLYDLIQQNALTTQLPEIKQLTIPGLSASYGYSYGPRPVAIPRMVPASRAVAASYGASYTPASNFSGMENPYGDIEW